MELYRKKGRIKNFLKNIEKKNLLYLLNIIFILIVFVSGVFFSNKIKSTKIYKSLVTEIKVFLRPVKNITKVQIVDIDNFDIDIKFKDWEKIRYCREQTLLHSKVKKQFQEKVPAKIRYKGETYKVEISLTGGMHDHVYDPLQWSLAVKVKGDKTIMGMKKFALLVPHARGYLTDWIAHKILKSRGVIGFRNNFIDVNINGNYHGVYYLEERFDKRLIENNKLREGIIFRLNLALLERRVDRNPDLDDLNYMNNIKVYNLKKIKENPELLAQLVLLEKLWTAYQNKDIDIEQVFDLQKFASVFVVTDLLNEKHGLSVHNMRLYYNPITGLIEPIAREWMTINENKKLGSLTIEGEVYKAHFYDNFYLRDDAITRRLYENILFKELYLKEATIISNQFYLDSIIADNKAEMNVLISRINKQNPNYVFPINTLHKHQKIIREKIYPSQPTIKVYFDSLQKDSLILLVENLTELPNVIEFIKYNDKKISEGKFIIQPNHEINDSIQRMAFKLSNSYDSSTFSSDSLIVHYNVLGINNSMTNYVGNIIYSKTIVFPKIMTTEDYLVLNKAKQPSNIQDFEFLAINEKTKIIEFTQKICNIKKDLIIPKGYVVNVKPNCKIDITNSARIISYSPIMFFGRKDSMVTICSSDSTGQGIVVFNCQQTSELLYVKFENLSNIFDNGWYLRGAITFYESPVNIDNCIFNNNIKGDDYLNIIRTQFNVTNTQFTNINADAFDADFCNGIIKNVKFHQIGNDAVDVSGTKVHIFDVEIVNQGDKGISGGEGSYLICENISINGGEIAIASKDNSTIEIEKISINSTKLAFCAFQKKSEFGPAKIIANNVNLKNIKTNHLIEINSSLLLNNKNIINKEKDVKQLLYGSEYGKSSK